MDILVNGVHGHTLAQKIRVGLAERIRSGELAPGARLKDNEVATLFGTSNTPAREALRDLARDGLVEILPYRGCIVRRVDLREVADAFEVRMALESFATRIAAGRLTTAQLAELATLAGEYDVAVANSDREAAAAAGSGFHALLIEVAGNRTLSGCLERLTCSISLARHLYTPRLRLPDVPPYRTILEALVARDGERAGALMAEHIAYGRSLAIEALQAHAAATTKSASAHGSG